MTIVEVSVSLDKASLKRRILRKHTKDHLAYQLARLYFVAQHCKCEETRRELDRIVNEVVW